jgi:hypothetical protein
VILLLDLIDVDRRRRELVLVIAPEDIKLRPMLEDLAPVIRRAAEARGLAFRAEFADDLPQQVRTDGRRLRNLLDNAVKYTDAGGVGLSAAPDPAASPADDAAAAVLVFTVSDTGRGIAQADQERLFAPFEQYDHGRDGSGLGLAICREFAGLLGGELSLASAPGRGSRFRFRLPVQVPAAAVADRDSGLAPIVGYAGPRRCVLVIDDSEMNRLLMAGLLGFDAFVLKPIEQGALCAAIADCLGLRWPRAAAERDQRSGRMPAPMPTRVPPPAPPPRVELDTAAELATLGDWPALRDWSTELDDAFPECAEFARRVRG